MRHPRVALLAVFVLALALAGCTSPQPGQPGSGSADPSTPPASAPAEKTPEAQAPPPIEELVLTTAGIAPIEVGSPVPEAAAALVTQTSEGCAEPYWRTNPAYDVDDATCGAPGAPSRSARIPSPARCASSR